MIKTLTIKQMAANKARVVATSIAVILGVAFLAGTLILTDTIKGTLNGVLAKADAGTDAYVRGQSLLNLGYGQSGRPLSAGLVETIRSVDGVDQVSKVVSGYAQIVDREGKAVGAGSTGVLGMNWVTVPKLNPFTLSSGRAPAGPGEIAIDRHSAKLAKLHVGDHTTVLSTGKPRPVTIVGITRFGNVDTPGALAVVLFDDATAEALLNAPGQVDGIAVTARPGVSPETLVARLAPAVGGSNEVLTGATLTKEHQRQIDLSINQFGTFLTIFALVSLLVGAFIINNTFSIIVSQRVKEMALLRAIGASGRQVRLAVLAEASVTGVVASTVGLAVGIGIARGLQVLLRALGIDLPLDNLAITSSTVIVSILAGALITVLSAVRPARRASKVEPIAALRDVAQDRSAVSKPRIVIGAAALMIATAIVVLGANAANVKIIGLGAAALLFATSALGPVLARPAANLLGAPMARLRGTAGALAQQNAIRNPKRTARTAGSLMIGVALVGFLTIFAASIKSSGAAAFRSDFRGTAVIDSGAVDSSSGLSPELAANLRTLPGVHAVAVQRNAAVEINGRPNVLAAYDTGEIARLFDLGHVQGDLGHLGADGIAVGTENGHTAVHLGDTRTITFPTGATTFTVRATYDRVVHFVGSQFVDLTALEANVPFTIDSRIYLDARDLSVIDRAAATYPTAKVLTIDAFIAQEDGTINTILTLMYVLLGLAVVLALLGIANTLALSIHERRRELGLLRAVGMTRAQVRASVRWESVIIALFGTTLGLGLGSFVGWAMVSASATQGFGELVVPVVPLLVVTVMAVGAGVAAALVPARRAARIDILSAIAAG